MEWTWGPDETHHHGLGEIARLVELQREWNEQLSRMTPEERAKQARIDLEHMPGRRYLFEP